MRLWLIALALVSVTQVGETQQANWPSFNDWAESKLDQEEQDDRPTFEDWERRRLPRNKSKDLMNDYAKLDRLFRRLFERKHGYDPGDRLADRMPMDPDAENYEPATRSERRYRRKFYRKWGFYPPYTFRRWERKHLRRAERLNRETKERQAERERVTRKEKEKENWDRGSLTLNWDKGSRERERSEEKLRELLAEILQKLQK